MFSVLDVLLMYSPYKKHAAQDGYVLDLLSSILLNEDDDQNHSEVWIAHAFQILWSVSMTTESQLVIGQRKGLLEKLMSCFSNDINNPDVEKSCLGALSNIVLDPANKSKLLALGIIPLMTNKFLLYHFDTLEMNIMLVTTLFNWTDKNIECGPALMQEENCLSQIILRLQNRHHDDEKNEVCLLLCKVLWNISENHDLCGYLTKRSDLLSTLLDMLIDQDARVCKRACNLLRRFVPFMVDSEVILMLREEHQMREKLTEMIQIHSAEVSLQEVGYTLLEWIEQNSSSR
jgi:hypothetical protein